MMIRPAYCFFLLLGICMLLAEKGYAQSCPTYVYAGKDSTICFSSNVVYLNGKIFRNATAQTGSWSGGTGEFASTTSLTTTYIPSQSEVNAGQVKIILNPTNCASTKRDTVVITIQKVVETNISGPATICEFSSGNSYSVPSVSGVSYDWHVMGGYVTGGATTNAISVTWGAEGPGYLYVIQTDALGCVGISTMTPVSRFHFNTPDLLQAEVGTNATSVDADVFGNGTGMALDANCGGTKGLDLVIPGSNFDRGKMCMTFKWQRDESDAEFFKRGGTEFYISGGSIRIKLTQISGAGSQVVGPINTGYTIPNDDVLRFFTFCYDSATGVARVSVNDSVIWNYQTPAATSLYGTGAGSATIGSIMDGNCTGTTLIDWANVSIPVSIFAKPETEMFGTSPVCLNVQKAYYCDTPSTVSYLWSGTGATVLSGSTGPYANITWTQSGSKTLNLLLTNTNTGCDSNFVFAVTVTALPTVDITGNDSLCVQAAPVYGLTSSGQQYAWSRSAGGTTSTTTTYSPAWNSTGQFNVFLGVTDTLTGCVNADTMPVWVKAYPDPTLTGPTDWCINDPAMVYLTNATGMNYSWSATGGSILSGQATSEVSVSYPSSGNYTLYVQVTDPDFGCSVQESLGVYVNPKPLTGSIFHY